MSLGLISSFSPCKLRTIAGMLSVPVAAAVPGAVAATKHQRCVASVMLQRF